MKVVVVRNRHKEGVICRFGQPCPEAYGRWSVQRVINALRKNGHTVAFFEGDKTLLDNLEKFMPPDPETGQPTGIVFNLSYGIQGECRYNYVPTMLEMAGIPYTGSSPFGHTLALDKITTKILMQRVGVPTPQFQIVSRSDQNVEGLHFPLIVKPRHESTSYGLKLVRSHKELQAAVHNVITQYQQEALVEEYIEGREIYVGLLGNDRIEFLPFVELDFDGRDLHTLTREDKYHKSRSEPTKICPAQVTKNLANRLREISLATFRACHVKDYARVDIRIDSSGNPFVLEINSMASLGRRGAFVLAAEKAGYNFQALISRILDITHLRYFGTHKPIHAPPVLAETENPLHPQLIVSPSELIGQDLLEADFRIKNGRGAARSTDHRRVQSPLVDNCMPPYKVTVFYHEQIRRNGCYEQLKHIVEPSLAELEDSGSLDTSGEHDNTKIRGLQHKYLQTALLIVTDQCFSYCRFCFRKRLVDKSSREVVQDYAEVSEYIKEHPEISDILLSGGDPFVLGTEQLQTIIDSLLPIPHLASIRFGTKAIVYYPQRFRDEDLAYLFKSIKAAKKTPVIVTHVDHFGEITKEMEMAVRKLRRRGIQFFNQTVLLRNVNDDPAVLAGTFAKLHALGIRPYYLFQARPVKGTLHFRVPLHRGIEIVRDVDKRLSGIQKTYRYIMSHYSGKVEILDLDEDRRLYLRYHQHRNPGRIGKVFSCLYPKDAYWLDDLRCESELTKTVDI